MTCPLIPFLVVREVASAVPGMPLSIPEVPPAGRCWHAQLMGEAMEYACHYCGRTDGWRTKDHKVPKVFGGNLLGSENIVSCCRMCNVIKSARHYGMFVALFSEFLELHGEQYLAANPDDVRCQRVMSRKFRSWPRRRGLDTRT